jgi:hypothetical protein
MFPDWKDVLSPAGVLVAALITQLVTIGVTIGNHRLTFRRYGQEKVWDIRRGLQPDPA